MQYISLASMLCMLLFTACAGPDGPAMAGSAGVVNREQAAAVLQKMADYKHLQLHHDYVLARRAEGRFLRLEYPDADGWVDMLTLQQADGSPLVVYVQSICEPDCEQQLRTYAYVNGRFVDKTEEIIPPNLARRLLTASQDARSDRRALGFLIDASTGRIDLYIYEVNDAQVYERMEAQGQHVGRLEWSGKAYKHIES